MKIVGTALKLFWLRCCSLDPCVFLPYTPQRIADNEKVVRAIMSPLHSKVDKNGQILAIKRNLFIPPTGRRDLSVSRLRFTNIHFCRALGRMMATEQNLRNPGLSLNRAWRYLGLSFSTHRSVILAGAAVLSTKQLGKPMHADILIPSAPVKGEPLEPAAMLVVDKLFESGEHFLDLNSHRGCWKGVRLPTTSTSLT